jgi:thiol-disulfide isomerase/thioredoxin
MANKFPNGRSVLELTGKDFKIEGKYVKVINSSFRGINGLIMAYAPWCPHCLDMVEPLLYLGDELKGHEFKLGAINSDNNSNKEICSALGVSGFPTLYGVNTKGFLKELEVSGSRSNDNLLLAICNMTKNDENEENSYCCAKENNKYVCKKESKGKRGKINKK